jgi:toxin FitB
MNNFVSRVQILQLDNVIADRTILIRQTHRLKLPDAVIAATCLENSLTVIARNQSDFGKISGLPIIDPYQI